jgi:hypothetical protein
VKFTVLNNRISRNFYLSGFVVCWFRTLTNGPLHRPWVQNPDTATECRDAWIKTLTLCLPLINILGRLVSSLLPSFERHLRLPLMVKSLCLLTQIDNVLERGVVNAYAVKILNAAKRRKGRGIGEEEEDEDEPG